MRKRLIIATHGSLAEGMLSAIKMIAGAQKDVVAFGLDDYETPDDIRDAVKHLIENNLEDHFIICCDLLCGSVHNALITLCKLENVQLISGVNLGLILALVLAPEEILTTDYIMRLIDEAKNNIVYFDKNTLLKSEVQEDDDLW